MCPSPDGQHLRFCIIVRNGCTCFYTLDFPCKLDVIIFCREAEEQFDPAEFPENYKENARKEKLVLAYAENFRRQYVHLYRDRKPLFLNPVNECGVEVCTVLFGINSHFHNCYIQKHVNLLKILSVYILVLVIAELYITYFFHFRNLCVQLLNQHNCPFKNFTTGMVRQSLWLIISIFLL